MSEGDLSSFAEVAPYLKDPLILVGFTLFVVFGFYRLLVKKGVRLSIQPVTALAAAVRLPCTTPSTS